MAKDLLVGSTGFVGGNLAAKHAFAAVCHSTDIAAQFGAKPDLCVYAGVPAAMFLANADPDADLAVMAAARENLRQIAPQTAGADLLHRCLCRQQGKERAEPHDTGRPARLWPQPPAAGTMGAGGLPQCADCAAACPIRHWAEKELFV